MGRPKSCNCRCAAPPPPDCFGCTDPSQMFPSVWQLDMPSAITTIGNRACGEVPVMYNPHLPNFRATMRAEVEYPSIPTTSLLLVDDRPIANYAFDYITCLWLSNDFWMFEKLRGYGVRKLFSSCPHGGHYPSLVRSVEWQSPTPWYYYENPWVGTSPNRARTHIYTDHPNPTCSTLICNPNPGAGYNCGYDPYGCQWALRIETAADGQKRLVAILHYFLRFTVRHIVEEWGGAGSGWGPYGGTYDSFISPERMHNSIAWPQSDYFNLACDTELFPAMSGMDDVYRNLLYRFTGVVRYDKVINCATDFDGTPVTLTKAYDFKSTPDSTKTVRQALSMGPTPSFITLTPII